MNIPHPTLIIGLGGTGQWVATHVLAELMSLYGVQDPNKLHPRVQILAIDTDFNLEANVGSGVSDILAGMNVGEIRLPKSKVVQLGANVVGYVQAIANGQHPEIGAWFDAKWFLNQPQYATLLNLTDGASQYRPLGRIAVPYNLTQSGESLRKALQKAIEAIRNHMGQGDAGLTVCIAGSLCGGTGAGMFVDVAYLVKQLAAPLTVHTRGYLVLPNAFEGTVPPAPDGGAAFRQRAFAAMRELRRFSREVNYERGYPMYYSSEEIQDDVLRGRLNSTLFELLYYFDASMLKQDDAQINIKAPVQDGVTPAIAEAILLWVDGRTQASLLSHAANLNAYKAATIAAGKLHPQAAVAGAMGIYSLQLPLHLFIEEWTHKLAIDVLDKFLGTKETDKRTRTVTEIRTDFAGDQAGQPGSLAARRDWERGQVGGVAVSAFMKDMLTTGREARVGKAHRDKRLEALQNRSLKEWDDLLRPDAEWSEEDEQLVSEFLYPPEIVLEKGGFLGRNKKVRRAQVRDSKHLSGDAAKKEKRNARLAADRIEDDLKAYFDRHLGAVDPDTGARGGSDMEPEGLYPLLLRRTMETYVGKYRHLLARWVAEQLNGVSQAESTSHDTPERAVRNRAAKLGFTLDLLRELVSMLQEGASLLEELERAQLGRVVDKRQSEELVRLRENMRKSIRNQEAYLKEQQEILEAERLYAMLRANRWTAGQMLAFTKTALESLEAWKDTLTKELYAAVWRGQDQVANNLRDMKRYSAVREVVEVPELKQQRYRYYAEQAHNALGEVLHDLRWQAQTIEVYDETLGDYRPVLQIGLQIGDDPLSLEGEAMNVRRYLQRCRAIFEEAREHETLLAWLREYYNDSTDARRVTALAQRLAQRGKLALRVGNGAYPYRLAYVRASFDPGSPEENWLRGLVTNVAQALGADAQKSQPVPSSDPYRLSFLSFHELIDVEKLLAYQEGRDGHGGTGGYKDLPAVSDGVGLSQQLLHVFAAEQNAVVYEERLSRQMGRRFMFSDKIVALLEDRDRFRQFVQTWLYGRQIGQEGTLLHIHTLPDIGDQGRKSVRRLTVGPFEGEIDPYTHLPKQPDHYWLTEPQPGTPSLYAAAETFCLGGADKWQNRNNPISIPYQRVQQQIQISRKEILRDIVIGDALQDMRVIVENFENEQQREEAMERLREYEYLQRKQIELRQKIIPAWERALGNWQQGLVGSEEAKAKQAEQRTQRELDLELLRLFSEFIVDEMDTIRRDIRQQRAQDQRSSARRNTFFDDLDLPIY